MPIHPPRAAGALISAALATVAFCASAVSAQTLQPGLWEVTSKLPAGNSDLAKLGAQSRDARVKAPALSSEQMAAMQNITMNSDGSTAMKLCMTKEMIARNQLGGQKGKCIYSAVDSSGSTRKFSFLCTDPAAKGEGGYTVLSPTTYTSSMTINSTQDGKPQTMTIASSGKFVNADCGNVKPMAVQ